MMNRGIVNFIWVLLLSVYSFALQAEEGHPQQHQSENNHAEHEQEHVDQAHAESHDAHTTEEHHEGGAVDTQEEILEYIDHHLQDSHTFNFWSNGEKGTHKEFSLPVILWDNGLQIFSSKSLEHGHATVEKNGNHYKLYHGKIYKTDASGTINYGEGHKVTNTRPLDFSITKSVVGMLLASILLLLGFGVLARGYKKGPIPSGVGSFLEPLVLFVRDEIAIPNIGEKKYRKYMGFLLTVFFFIWILNLLGLTPLGFNVTGNIAVTACLAIFTFLIVNLTGNKHYWGHMLWMPGVPVPLKPVMAVIELIGAIIKPFSLMVRLFANITAGHFVVMSLIALTITLKSLLGAGGAIGVSFLLSMFIMLIEVLVAFLQAYIFTMLSSLFIGMAVEEHDDHH